MSAHLNSLLLLCSICLLYRAFPCLLSRTLHVVFSTSSLTFLIDSSLSFPCIFSRSISFRKVPSPHFLEEPFCFTGLCSNYNADNFQRSWKALLPNSAGFFFVSTLVILQFSSIVHPSWEYLMCSTRTQTLVLNWNSPPRKF